MSRDASRPRGRLVAVSLTLVLGASLVPLATVSAAATLTTPANDSTISADLTGTSNYDTLTGPVITENGAAALGTGTIVLNAPSGFQFRASAGSVGVNSGCDMAVAIGPVTTGSVTATISTVSTVPLCVLTFSGIQVQPTTGVLPNSGDITRSGTASGAPAGPYGHLVMVAGAPVLTFTAQPSGSAAAGVAFTTQPVVHDVDQFSNIRAGDAITLGTAPGSVGTVQCTTNPVTVGAGGNATFAGCSVQAAQAAFRLRASTLTSFVDSSPFAVTSGPASRLVFTSSPAANTSALLSPQPAVAIVDSFGNVVADARSVTIDINQFGGTFSCTSGKTVAAVDGVATFAGCTQTTVGTNYVLTATASGLTSGSSAFFNVNSGVAGKIVLCWGPALPCQTTPPNPVSAAIPFNVQPTVRILDGAGNQVPNDTTTVVTIGIQSGTPTSGGPGTLTCLSSLSITVTNGVGTYSGCKIDKIGTGYQLVATANPALSTVTSGAFDVVAGPPTKLLFIAQPSSAPADSVFGTAPKVAIVDAGGNIVGGFSATIELAIDTNPAGGTLTCSGGTSVATVEGVATFAGCKIDVQGTGYTLKATITASTPPLNLPPAVSKPFDVLAPAASIVVTASKSVITWGEKVTIHVHFGMNGAAKSFVLQGARDGSNFSAIASLTTDSAGDASFEYKPANNLYYRAQFAGAPDLPAGISGQTRVVVRQIDLLRPTVKGHTRTVLVGTVVKFTSTVRPARPDLPKSSATWVVYQLVKGKWTRIISQRLSSANGVTTLALTFSIPGSFYVRSIANPTPFNANSAWSPIERYDVTLPIVN